MQEISMGSAFARIIYIYSFLNAIFSIIGSIFLQIELLYLLFVSIFLVLLTILCLKNKVQLDKHEVRINFLMYKHNYPRKKLVEIFISSNIFGFNVILNFKERYDIKFCYEKRYIRTCQFYDNRNYYCLFCRKKDLQIIINYYKGKIVFGNKNIEKLKYKLILIGAKDYMFKDFKTY